MVSHDEAFLLFYKWADEGTQIRFDGQSALYSFSLTGRLERATEEVLRLRVREQGYLEIHVPPTTAIEYFDPETIGIDLGERVGQGQSGEAVLYGAGLAAIKQTGEKFHLLEIVS